MARPLKHGMDYFPHDTDAAADEKIDALRMYHGNDGYAFYFILCERIYRSPNAELDISNPMMIALMAKRTMVTIEKFNEILATSFLLGLFSADAFDQRGVITSNGIKTRTERIVGLRSKWRREKVIHRKEPVKVVFHAENPSFPQVIRELSAHKELKERKDLKELDQDQEIKTHSLNAHVHATDQAPQPFAYEGSLDVWNAVKHYGIKMHGLLKFEFIRAFQGVLTDELILAGIKESAGQSDGYCLKVLESWHQQGWRKLEDHPLHHPLEGGDVVAINWGRNQSYRHNPRNATASAFEEIGKRSRSGKLTFAPRE